MRSGLFAVAIFLSLGLTVAAQQPVQFTDVTAESGLWDVPTGWGVTVEDVDRDGNLDLIFANNGSENAAFYNQGKLQFRGRPIIGGSAGTEALVPADFDGDGFVDLVGACWGGPPALFRNDGTGRFIEVAADYGLEAPPDTRCGGAAIGDADGDGTLDIFLPESTGKDVLYAYLGGKYENVTAQAGLPQVPGGESATFFDVDDDRDLDLYVARSNDKSALYLNDGTGTFQDLSANTQLFAATGNCGVVFADLDNDGDADLLQVNGAFGGASVNRLLRNDGGAKFVDATPESWKAESGRWFSAAVGDINNDGNLDVYFTGLDRNLLLLNQSGLKFAPAPDPCPPQPGQACCGSLLVDLDGDGDLDLVTRHRAGLDYILRNDRNDNNWLEVRPISAKGNPYCLGARLRVFKAGGLGDMRQFVARRDLIPTCGWGSYMPYVAHFGLDAGQRYDLEVRYADGTAATETNVQPGRYLEISPR